MSLKEEVADLRQQLAMYKKLVHGQKSEKTEVVLDGAEQLHFFDEAEAEENRKEREAEKPVVVPAHTRKQKRTHEEMVADLPVEEVVHTADDRECAKCCAEMEAVGKELVRDELVYIPARPFCPQALRRGIEVPGVRQRQRRRRGSAGHSAVHVPQGVRPRANDTAQLLLA